MRRAFGGRLRFAVSGGAPLSRKIAEFFHAVGILIVEGYGLTEACPVLTFNRITDFKFGSVGQAIPGVELQILPDGEILARGPNIATRGYFKRPEDTAQVFGPDGWLRTGDVGHLDDEGFLYVTDRKKDLIVTSGGLNIAPQLVEQLLRRDAFIGDAMIYGDRRPYPTAFIALNPSEVARFARERGLLVSDDAQLAQHPEIMARVKVAVDAANGQLQSYAHIKRFAVIPGELTEAGGELTPTQKMKQGHGREVSRPARRAVPLGAPMWAPRGLARPRATRCGQGAVPGRGAHASLTPVGGRRKLVISCARPNGIEVANPPRGPEEARP